MKIRTSTRSRKPPPKTYSFQSSSPSASPPPSPPPTAAAAPRRRVRRRSSSFTAPDSAPDTPLVQDQDHDEDQDEKTPSSHPTRPSARRAKKKTPTAPASTGKINPPAGTYLDVESVTTDTHLKGYTGPYDRSMRGQTLISTWYGPDPEAIRVLQGLLNRWMAWTVLPPKWVAPMEGDGDDDGACASSARRSKTAGLFANGDRRGAFPEYPHHQQQQQQQPRYIPLYGSARQPFEQPHLGIRLLMGPSSPSPDPDPDPNNPPHHHHHHPHEWTMYPGDAHPLTQSWLPYHEDPSPNKLPTGWILDAGGLVTSMDWSPQPRGHPPQTQLLALAVIPHADQQNYHYESEHQRPGFHAHGTVQVWALEGLETETETEEQKQDGAVRPSLRPPRLTRTIYYIAHTEATLLLENEASVKATAMAWATPNRLVVGYSDGSVALWSIYPCFLISRQPVHHSLVVDLATGYPSQPFLVASTPVGGVTKLVDLSRPTFETTEVQTNAVSWQPNMLAYSHHLQGFYSVYPSANALNTMVSFLHQRFFPLVRRVFVGDSYNSSLAVGQTHPFLLIGSTDGSLWSLNPQCELFNSRRGPTDRLRVFQHEHRSKELFPPGSPASERGVSRFLHGFAVEKGRRPKAEVKPQPAKKQKRPKKADVGAVEGIDDDDDEEAASVMDPTRGIVYEPLSRITSIEWNPNPNFGCWAAAATASGLVRIMDLGLDNVPG
ncbi:hypothetical protein E4U55_004104 [Claviceps digitariae]|nr:hypothetical protein E4U55_004104 [Claviceps digitariae]